MIIGVFLASTARTSMFIAILVPLAIVYYSIDTTSTRGIS